MKRILLLPVLLLFTAILPASEIPELKIIYPNGGETLFHGESVLIKWVYKSPDTEKSVVLVLYKEGIKFMTISKAVTGSDSYLWVVPDTVPRGTSYRVRIRSNRELSLNDFSDRDFSILPKK